MWWNVRECEEMGGFNKQGRRIQNGFSSTTIAQLSMFFWHSSFLIGWQLGHGQHSSLVLSIVTTHPPWVVGVAIRPFGGGLAIWEPLSKDLGVVETITILSLGGVGHSPWAMGVAHHPQSGQIPHSLNVQRDGCGHSYFFFFFFLFF
jgi:hypothetical protein